MGGDDGLVDLRQGGGALAPISKLPIFLDLAGRPAILAGDTAGLAWKAELIGAAGALVRVFSPCPSAELRAAARRLEGPRFSLIERNWTPEDLIGAAIAVADLHTLAEAAEFKAAGDACGVLVNTVDKGGTCDFYFGAVVSRSPIMIGLTTDGSAPILGQTLRRVIELAAPKWLGAWGDLAREVRPLVKRRLAPGLARRTFWEAFSEMAFAAPPRPGARDWLLALAEEIAARPVRDLGSYREIMAPADADDLTLGEAKSLQSADVIIEDAGVDPAIRAFFRREATRLLVARAGVEGELGLGEVEGRIAAERAQGRSVTRLRVGGGAA
jgi:uroporphyrin-III C-methyltransferase/precorrin-2 dehydrogenase/sirohydrochlorin ferrochelatase